MSKIIQNIDNKEVWQKSLGLLPTKFLPSSEEKFVMQNGQQNNFCIDFNNDYDVEKYRHFSWASDTNCFLNFENNKLNLFRWDKPIIESINLNEFDPSKLIKLYKYIGKFTQPKQNSVVPLILDIFSRLRNATGSKDGFWALQSLLYLLTKSENNNNIDFEKWGLNQSIQNNLPQQFDNIFEDFQNRINKIPNTTKIILRHASGKLFQEAHYQALISGQLDIFGVPIPSKTLKEKELNGVHFTPAFITRSIIEESIRNFNFKELAEIKILDPACGSGEFLKEALRQIIENHLDFVGAIKIYGWDLSKTATEVANFSLHFEKSQYPSRNIEINILRKDSLEDNWGEFDLIFMNPPFVSWELLENQTQEKVRISLENYFSSRPNLASPFFYKALKALKKNGTLGCVMPSSIFNADSYKELRNFASQNFNIELIGKLGNLNLFYNAVVDAGIYIAHKTATKIDSTNVLWADNSLNSTTDALRNLRIYQQNPSISINELNFSIYKSIYNIDDFPNLISYSSYKLEKKITELLYTNKLIKLKNIFEVKQGARTGANDTFLVDVSFYNNLSTKEKRYFRPAVINKSIKNGVLSIEKYLFFPTSITTEEELINKVPVYYENILKHDKPLLQNRARKNESNWWKLSEHRAWQVNEFSKLVSTEFGKNSSFAIDLTGKFVVERGYGWFIKENKSKNQENLNYAYLAFFCSEFFNNLLALYSKQIAGGQYYLGSKFVNNIPIPDLTLEQNLGLADELIKFGRKICDSNINEFEKTNLNKLIENIYQI